MKKNNLKNLRLNKKVISNFSMISVKGGAEVSIRETNCDQCPRPLPEPESEPFELPNFFFSMFGNC